MSIPTRSHVEIAQDELDGLAALGYTTEGFSYSARQGIHSKIGRLRVVIHHALLLLRKAYRFKPDVIYFNSRLEKIAGTRDFLTVLLLRVFYLKPVSFVLKSHGSDLEVLHTGSGFWMQQIVLPFLRKNISAWLFLSTEEKNMVVATGFLEEKKLFVVKNIVRTGQFQRSPDFCFKHNIPPNSIILLYTGRFIREKGVFEVIEGFIQIARQYQVYLILVGDGPEKQKLEDKIKQAQLENQVLFTGFIPEQQVVPYYSNADVLVFPTYFPEGFPMALFNAVGAGLSIITTATRAATDYLQAPENCLWVEPKNSQSVANEIEVLLTHPLTRAAMAIQNRRMATLFSREEVCAELSYIIESVLNRIRP